MSEYADPFDALERELQGVSPYPGLRPFLPEESRFFRGRAAQIEEIGRRLAEQGCVAVLGGSGCGKSSIVRAGVVPALRRKLIPGRGDLWRTAIFTPGLTPIDNLVAALTETLRPALREAAAGAVREMLYGPDGLGGFLPAFRGALDIDPGVSAQALERANLLIVVDQFEELFRDVNRGKRQSASLIELVVDYWQRRDAHPGLFLALTMRTDDLHRCAEFIELPDLINATSYLTRRLTEEELRDAIVGPVRPPLFRAGLLAGIPPPGTVDLRPYDVQVVTELLDAAEEIAHDPDHLPLLQHLLAILWRHTLLRWQRAFAGAGSTVAPPQVTCEDLAGALGFTDWPALQQARALAVDDQARGWLLKHCLQQVAEDLYQGSGLGTPLTEVQRGVARTAFCLMGEVDDRGSFKRRWTNEQEIAQVAGLSGPDPDTQAVVRRFSRDHRLLWVRDTGDLDLSHESLMRNWPRLARWLNQDRDAGAAYRRLGDACRRWDQANAGFPPWLRWLSGFRKRDGLLGSEALERIEPVLVRPVHWWSVPQPRYTSAWAQRYLSVCAAGDPLEQEYQYRNRLRYLRLSILRGRVGRAIPAGVVLLLLVTTSITAIAWHRSAEQQTQLVATLLWDGLKGWGPINTPEYIDTLWQVARVEPATRREFVRQIPKGDNLKQMGFRGKPIVRAIGLRWPEQSERLISDAFRQELAKPGAQGFWTEASLACATTALSDRLATDCHDLAIKRFDAYLNTQTMNSPDPWPMGRILSCLDPRLSPAAGARLQPATMRKVLQEILAISREALTDGRSKSATDLGRFASATAVVAWAAGPGDELVTPADRAVFDQMVSALIAQLTKPSNDPMAVAYTARPLVSLIAALPPTTARAALGAIIKQVNDWSKRANPDLLLILAQSFEVVARQHQAAGTTDKLSLLVATATGLLTSAGPNPDAVPIGKLAVARLGLPLAEVSGGGPGLLAALDGLGQGPLDLTTATDLPNAWGEAKDAGRLLLGLKARALALRVTTAPATVSDPAPTMEEVLQVLDRVPGGGAGPAPSARDGAAAAGTGADPGLDRTRPAGFDHFAREGLAHLVAALARNPGPPPAALTETRRAAALQSAKAALARTGSAEEAAAWARAITALLDPRDDVAYVDEVTRVLKYPNTGLTAREPNADEPRDATDILIQALAARPDIQPLLVLPADLFPRPGYHRRVLEKIVRDPRFAHIDLETRPRDPLDRAAGRTHRN